MVVATVLFALAMLMHLVHGQCPPLPTGLRFLGCVDLYKRESNGSISMPLEYFAGLLPSGECMDHCSCEGYSLAAHNATQNICFCGSVQPSPCGSNSTVCLNMFNLTGIGYPTAVVPARVAMFENVTIRVAPTTSVGKFAFKYGMRYVCCASNMATVSIAPAGNISFYVLNEGFSGCQSIEYKIVVYPATKLKLTCPEATVLQIAFTCKFELISGLNLHTLTWKEGSKSVSSVTNFGNPVIYEVGTAMDYHPSIVFEQSFNPSLLEQRAFININQAFTAYGQLQGFEVHATRPGKLQFIVLKPMCSENGTFKYCPSLRSCVPLTNDCPEASNLLEYARIPAATAFCASTAQIFPQAQTSCPNRTVFTAPGADYEVVYMQEVSANYTGNNAFSVADDVVVYPGYVLGWIPSYDNPADLGYYELDPADEFHVFTYPEVYRCAIGGRFSRFSGGANVSTLAHMLKAHVSTTQTFESIRFAGQEPGKSLTISVDLLGGLGSSFSISQTMSVESFIVVVAQVVMSRFAIYEGQEVTLTAYARDIRNMSVPATLCIHWGLVEFTGDCDVVTSATKASQTYDAPGVYTIFVKAYNNVSQANTTRAIRVYTSNSVTLNWAKESPILPVATGQSMTATILANGSGEYALVYKLGDMAPVALTVALSDFFLFYIEYAFTEPTTAYCTFNLSHPMASKFLAAYSFTQNLIDTISVRPVSPVATNESVSITPSPNNGTNITYIWLWGDGGIDFSFRGDVVNHPYRKYGNWTVFFNASNLVSNQTASFMIPVYDQVITILFSDPRLNAVLGSVTRASVIISQGSGMNISFDYGDGTKQDIACDIDQAGIVVFASTKHTYASLGYYNLSVTARNPVSTRTIWQMVPVEVAVTDFNVVCLQDEEGFLEIGENLSCAITIAKGTNVLFNVSFGDESAVITSSIVRFSHRYKTFNVNPGFIANFTAFNNVSQQSKSFVFPVQPPVKTIAGFSVWSMPGNWTERIKIFYNLSSDTFFTCIWKVNDGSGTLLYSNHTNYILKPYMEHRFQPGSYLVEVNCSNRLYTVAANTTVVSQRPVSDFDITATYDCGNGREPGKGVYENIYPMECNVTFVMVNQQGSNVSYFLNFGYVDLRGTEATGDVLIGNAAVHMFLLPGKPLAKEVTVSVLARNAVSQRVNYLKVILYQRVYNVSLTSDSPGIAGKPINFTFKAEQLGYQTCFRLSWGDSSTGLVFGDGACSEKLEYKFDKYDSSLMPATGLGPPLSKISYIYNTIGSLLVTITAENIVSRASTSIWVKVEDKPCLRPTLSWTSAMGTTPAAASSAPFKRCMSYLVTQRTINNCEKTNLRNHTWLLERIEVANETNVRILQAIDVKTNDSVLEITPRWLEYGLYQLSLNVCMTGVPDACSTLWGYFSIAACDLEPKIFGGSGRAVAWNQTITVNGTLSSDPDAVNPTNKNDLVFTWYCKHKDEEWPADLNMLPEIREPQTNYTETTPNKTSNFGCYGNGIGFFSSKYEGGALLQLNTFHMMMFSSYDILFLMAQRNSSRAVRSLRYELMVMSTLDPPQMTVVCKQNCEKKQIINSKISLVATCQNYADEKLSYSWSMSSVEEHEKDAMPTDQTALLSSCLATKLDGSNLVIKPYCLQTGYIYTVKIKASITNTKLYGFSLYTLMINRPPERTRGGGCLVNPPEGYMLEKVFEIRCFGYEDTDLPLTYNFFYVQDEKEVKIIGTANPSSGLFQLGLDVTSLFAVVTDVYGAESDKMFISVKVNKKEIKADDLSKKIENLDASNPEEAGPVLFAVLATAASSPTEGSNKVVDMIMNSIAQMEPKTADACLMISGVANTASSGGGGQDTTTNALSALGKAGSDKCASLMSPDQQSKVAEDVLQSIGKLTATLAGPNAESTFKAAAELETKVALQSASSMVPGEAPKEIKVNGGIVQVAAIDPSKGGSIGGGISLPKGVGGAVVASNREMRQTFSPSSAEVKGNTQGLSTSSGAGKKDVVKNLTEPVVLRMPSGGNFSTPPFYMAYKEMLPVIHAVPCTANASVLVLKLKPASDNFTGQFFVFMEKGATPSYVNHRWNCTLPNPEPLDHWNMTESQRDHYGNETRWRCWFDNQQLNSTCLGKYYIGVIYKSNLTDNFAATLAPTDIPISRAESKRVDYYFYGYTRTCLYWDEIENTWSGEGCNASPESSDEFTVCHCSHLTDFAGGGLLATPQPIDFSKAFAGFSNLGENPTVFAVVMSMIGVFFMLLAWCRWKDKKDLLKIAIAPLEENHPNDTYFYEIAVQTGYKVGASTSADVFIIISGSLSETAPKRLANPLRKCFQHGETDVFLLATPYDLGDLREIEVWHNNAGPSPGWHLMQVQIRDVQSEKRYRFVCNKWLDVAEDDGLIQRKIRLAEKEELLDFSFVFAQTSRKNLFDGHIWFSVFTRPPQSTFTRCQRLNCCWSLLLTTMLSNAMFYTGGDAPGGESIQIGPIAVSIEQIKIGFTSSLVVVPVNLLIVTLFKKAGPPKKTPSKHQRRYSETGGDASDAEKSSEKEKGQSCIQFLHSILFPGKEEVGKKAKRRQLPHWLIYVAYFVVFLSSSVSAFFVILYGFTFGKAKSDKWIVSMLVSLTQSILVIQPVKVIALSVVFAMLLKDPNKAEEEEEKTSRKGEVVQREKGGEEKKVDQQQATADELRKLKEQYSLPSEQKLQEARLQRLKEKQMKAIVREIVVHLLFLALCLLVAYAAMDPYAFGFAEGTKSAVANGGIMGSYVVNNSDDVVKAEKITREAEWYDWVEKSVIPYLFPGAWYTEGFPYEDGFVADNEPSKVLSLARFRQLRVKPNTCSKHPVFNYVITQCNGGYSWDSEDTGKYSARWKPPLNNSERFALRKNKRKALWMGLETPWRYRSALELKSFPFLGQYALYGGGSFAVNIGPNQEIASKIIKNVKDNFWVDRYTRALFIDANIYNANTNLFQIVTLLHEVTPDGGWTYFYNIQSLRLYRYNGGLGSIIMLVDFVFVIVTVVGIYRFGKSCYRNGCRRYFTDSWNILHVMVTFLSVGAIGMTIARALALKFAMDNYTEDPEIFVSFAYVGQHEYFIMAFIGLVVFLTNLEFLRLLRFNKKISQLTTTLKSCMGALASFAVVFFTMFVSFVSFAHFIYCEKLEDFRTFTSSFVAMVFMFLGKFDVHQYMDNAPLFGPLLFMSYMIIIQFVLINFFVGIVCDAFVEIREQSLGQDNEYEIMSFITKKFKNLAGDNEAAGFVPIYVEWKSDWEATMDRVVEQCDSAIYLLRNVENDEIRQEKWFSQMDQKKRNVLVAILGLDHYDLDAEFCDSIPAIERRLKKMSLAESEKLLAAASRRRQRERDD